MSRISAKLTDSRPSSTPGYKGTLELTPANGFAIQNFSTGFPDIRDSEEKRSQQNGAIDDTSLFGARAVTMTIGLVPERCTGSRAGMTDDDLETELRGWMAPHLRPYLRFSRNGGELRRMQVRSQQGGAPASYLRNDFVIFTAAWRAPDGVIEVDEIESVTLFPGSDGAEDGRAYDLSYPRDYPASAPVGVKAVVNRGTIPVLPVITLYGPMEAPTISNITTGESLVFDTAFELLVDEYLVIDFKEGTVLLNGDESNSRYDQIDFSQSTWWSLRDGVNNLLLFPTVYSSPAQALVEFRSAYI